MLYRQEIPEESGDTSFAAVRNIEVKVENEWHISYSEKLLLLLHVHIDFKSLVNKN